jgi:hypothetical protein
MWILIITGCGELPDNEDAGGVEVETVRSAPQTIFIFS